jgi:hypothetical protein
MKPNLLSFIYLFCYAYMKHPVLTTSTDIEYYYYVTDHITSISCNYILYIIDFDHRSSQDQFVTGSIHRRVMSTENFFEIFCLNIQNCVRLVVKTFSLSLGATGKLVLLKST